MNFHTSINDLPVEILIIIFQDLQFKDIIENCSNTCMKWRFIVAHYFMQPYLKKLARHHLDLRKTFESVGWTEECSEMDLILTLCERHMCYKRSPPQKDHIHLQIEKTYVPFDVEKAKRNNIWSKSPILLLPIILTILVIIYFALRKYGILNLI